MQNYDIEPDCEAHQLNNIAFNTRYMNLLICMQNYDIEPDCGAQQLNNIAFNLFLRRIGYQWWRWCLNITKMMLTLIWIMEMKIIGHNVESNEKEKEYYSTLYIIIFKV